MAILQRELDFATGKKQTVDWRTRVRAYWINNFCAKTEDPLINCQRTIYIAEGSRAQELVDLMESITQKEKAKTRPEKNFSPQEIEKLADDILKKHPIFGKKTGVSERNINTSQSNLVSSLKTFLRERLNTESNEPYIQNSGVYATSSKALEGTAEHRKHRRLVTSMLASSTQKNTSNELKVKMPTFANTVGINILNPILWPLKLPVIILRLTNLALFGVPARFFHSVGKKDTVLAHLFRPVTDVLKVPFTAAYYGISILLHPMRAWKGSKKRIAPLNPENITSVMPNASHRRTPATDTKRITAILLSTTPNKAALPPLSTSSPVFEIAPTKRDSRSTPRRKISALYESNEENVADADTQFIQRKNK